MHRKFLFRILPVCLLTFLAQQSLSPSGALAYELDKNTHTITVSPGENGAAELKKALAYLVDRADKDTKWTVKVQPGKYTLAQPLDSTGLKNAAFISDPASPATLIKAPGFAGGDYLFSTRLSSNITISGFQFYGKTNFAADHNPVWHDSGLYFGSSRYVIVQNNKFYNFGDAALRVTTSETDPVKGVNSFDTKVVDNVFNNVYQITTASTDPAHGGTARYSFQDNQVANLRGSVKFSSHTTGAQDVHITGNTINGGDHFGLEIHNYTNLDISGNTIQNIKEVAINIATGTKAQQGFRWGDNFAVKSNTLKNVGRGIRFSPDPFADGATYTPKNLVIDGNTLAGVTNTEAYPAISVTNGNVAGVKVTNNKLSAVANKNYIGISPGSTDVSKEGNTVDGAPYNPTTATPKAAAKK